MTLTYSAVIKRALIAGLAAGLLFALYLVVVAEPTIDRAVAIEDAQAEVHHDGHHGEAPLFTRGEQVSGGMLAGVLFAGLVSVVLGTVYASVRHRFATGSDFQRVLVLAAAGFATTALFPAVKYPANPPAVGDPDTVGTRTAQYVGLLVFAIVAAIVVAKLSGQLRARVSDQARIVLLVGAVALLYGGALVAFPGSPDSIDPSMPADLIWRFRIQSLGGLALLWSTLGLGFGWLMARAAAPAVVTEGLPAHS
jgi:predicted cobalt transporter CbtA